MQDHVIDAKRAGELPAQPYDHGRAHAQTAAALSAVKPLTAHGWIREDYTYYSRPLMRCFALAPLRVLHLATRSPSS